MRPDTRQKRRLSFHKETLRVLTPEDLAGAAGGRARPKPKSNAWTGEYDQAAYDSMAVC